MSPLQRSKRELEKRGYTVDISEHWNSFARRRVDLFSFADLVAFRGNDTLLVQTTSGANVSARIAKINETQAAALWKESPNRRILVHGWAKRGERGKRKTWTCREIEV